MIKKKRQIPALQLFHALLKHEPGYSTKQISYSSALSRTPKTSNPEDWCNYWQTQKQPWRHEPEINPERQEELSKCRLIQSDINQNIYPFKGMKLTRADVEWLLSTHENNHGPVDWIDTSQQNRQGLDLRGTDLRGIDLSGLPLAKIVGGLTGGNWAYIITAEQRNQAAVHLEGAYLKDAHLEGAILGRAHLERAYLGQAYLERAYLRAAHLEGVDFGRAHLEGADLSRARLDRAYLREAHLEGANLAEAHLEGASLREAYLEGKCIRKLNGKCLEMLDPTDLRGAYFDTATNLEGAKLGNGELGFVPLADIRWSNINLSVVNWATVKMLGDEQEARRVKKHDGSVKNKEDRFRQYRTAVRANRQLAVALRGQGLNEEASRFAYRAQVLERKVLWWQRKPLSCLFSWFLFLIAGYGYRPIRSIITYLLVIAFFAAAYFVFGVTESGPHHLKWYESIVVSLTAFHGRGFLSDQFKPGDPQSIIAAIEAAVGLVIEIIFIATFTQRFFGR
jgi:uncharacterized protein YjbI with pentapeptide repeats